MAPKRKQRQDREQAVLLGLIELYLLTRSPIGSNTLRKNGFEHLSSATIRNYFVRLEKQGFLHQHHSSGGRIPTPHAYKFYAMHHFHCTEVDAETLTTLKTELNWETRKIAAYLEQATNTLSRLTQGAVFFSSPRFDQDFITAIQLLAIDHQRYLCAITTSFGLIRTEILHLPKKLSRFTLNRIEAYFRFRLTGLDHPELCPEEETIATQFYNEILLRYIVSYANFNSKDIYKTGFSRLLQSPEFRDSSVLATGLSLFENTPYMTKILNHCLQTETLKCWIGDDLDLPQAATLCSSVTAIPYFIHGKPVGAVAVLGPIPAPYPKLFGILRTFSTLLSENLTRNLYKYKVTYRQPSIEHIDLQKTYASELGQVERLQLEDQTPPSY
ncbi:MAG: heat-inducible transcriptional repressor HrcA [Chlamydiota bacterium]